MNDGSTTHSVDCRCTECLINFLLPDFSVVDGLTSFARGRLVAVVAMALPIVPQWTHDTDRFPTLMTCDKIEFDEELDVLWILAACDRGRAHLFVVRVSDYVQVGFMTNWHFKDDPCSIHLDRERRRIAIWSETVDQLKLTSILADPERHQIFLPIQRLAFTKKSSSIDTINAEGKLETLDALQLIPKRLASFKHYSYGFVPNCFVVWPARAKDAPFIIQPGLSTIHDTCRNRLVCHSRQQLVVYDLPAMRQVFEIDYKSLRRAPEDQPFFSYPCIDALGRIFVVDSDTERLYVIGVDGRVLAKACAIKCINEVAFDSNRGRLLFITFSTALHVARPNCPVPHMYQWSTVRHRFAPPRLSAVVHSVVCVHESDCPSMINLLSSELLQAVFEVL